MKPNDEGIDAMSAVLSRRAALKSIGASIATPMLTACATDAAVKSNRESSRATPDLTDYARFSAARAMIDTSFGRIACVSNGSGPAAVFLHGAGVNSYHWRHQLTQLASIRRCLAIDLMGSGHTEFEPSADVSFTEQASMVLVTMDKLGIGAFDLVGNDSGGAVAQLVAVQAPDRVRSLVLSNCEVHDNWPPPALTQAHRLATAGKLADVFAGFVAEPSRMRAAGGFAHQIYEDAAFATDELIRIYLGPPTSTPARRAAFNRYVGGQEKSQLVAIESKLRELKVPTMVLWGSGDVFFELKWAYWLRDTIPGVTKVVELRGARIFFAEERPEQVCRELSMHWMSV